MKANPPSRITVFGSSSPLPGDPAYQLAFDLGCLAGRYRLEIVNGGYTGTMEASARGAVGAGGTALGVLVGSYTYASPNRFLTKTVRTDSLLERLDKLLSLGDIIVVLPGGTGTLVELSLAWEYSLKRLHAKPVLIDSCWQWLLEMLPPQQLAAEIPHFAAPFNRSPLFSDTLLADLESLLNQLQ